MPRPPSISVPLLVVFCAVLSPDLAARMGAQEVLLEFGETWRFFKGTRDPSPGTTDWTSLEFDDSSWSAGPLGIGYGDGDDATVLEDMRGNYSSIFLRRVFDVDDPDAVENLVLTADFDDGFVCFVNGEMVAVANVATHEGLSRDSFASSSHEAGTPELFDLLGSVHLLKAGENIIAVQVLNQNLESSDVSFDARLTTNDPDFPVLPSPSDYDVTFKLSSVTVPTDSVDPFFIPFSIVSDQPTSGFGFSIDFDEEKLEAVGVTLLWERPDGQGFEQLHVDHNNDNANPGNHGVDEGYFVGCGRIASSSDTANLLPPGENTPLLLLELRLREDVSPGRTAVVLTDRGVGDNGRVCFADNAGNYVRGESGLVLPESAGSFEFIDAEISIGGERPPVFLRGDCNGDGKVDVTDPINNLSFQFQGAFDPPCKDALDFDDNGAIEVTDPIGDLTHQFLGGPPAAPPGKVSCGPDPTPDSDVVDGDLGCERYPTQNCP